MMKVKSEAAPLIFSSRERNPVHNAAPAMSPSHRAGRQGRPTLAAESGGAARRVDNGSFHHGPPSY